MVQFRNCEDSVGFFQVNEQAAATAGCSCAWLCLHQGSMGGAVQQEKHLQGAGLVLGGLVGVCLPMTPPAKALGLWSVPVGMKYEVLKPHCSEALVQFLAGLPKFMKNCHW